MLLAPSLRGLARQLSFACLALTAATAAVFAQTNTPSADDGFDPNIDGNVYAMVTQTDGKILVAGQFANVSPNGGISIGRNNLARLNPDGTLDDTFKPDVNGAVRTIALQGDKVLIGGDFTKVGGEDHGRVARLNSNGTVDSTFKGGVGPGTGVLATTPQVFAIVVHADGFVVGGTFGTATSPGISEAHANVARFTVSGAVDQKFNPAPNAMVLALVVHQANKIVIGGAFTSVSGSNRPYLARLNSDGSLDTEFDPQPNDGVTSLAVQPDGKIVLGGYFTTLSPRNPDGSDRSAQNRPHVARLNGDVIGSIDTEFYPTVAGAVDTVAVAPDGGIFIGGRFSQLYDRGNVAAVRPFAAKFATDGTIDTSFTPSPNGVVDAFAFQPDGKVIIGGYFTRLQPSSASSALVRNHIARVLADGAVDTAFQLDLGGRVLASVTDKNGNVIIGGSFTTFGGATRYYLARLDKNGNLDPTYNPYVNGRVLALAYDSKSDKVIVGGAFTAAGPTSNLSLRNNIVRLNSDGSVDSEFNPNFDGTVGAIYIQSDGNILVGGAFGNVHPFGTTDVVARPHLARLTTAGQLDSTFYPNPNGNVGGIAVQSDGRIIVIGSFTGFQPNATGNGTTVNYLARLKADGTVDGSYLPHPNNAVSTVVVQKDDKVVVGGMFTGFFPGSTITRVDRNFIARLNTDGTVDAAFDPHANNRVLSLGLLSDGTFIVGGAFTTFGAGDTGWTQAKYVGHLNADGTADKSFNLDLNELPGNVVDLVAVQPDNNVLIGGSFVSLQPAGTSTRVLRNHLALVTPKGALVTTFVPGATGGTSATVKAVALQADGSIVVGGNFADLGGATSKGIARYLPEGSPDGSFNAVVSTEGTVNAIGVRSNGVVAPSQLTGLAVLDVNGRLVSSFSSSIRLQGQVNATAIQKDGKILLAGSFADLTNQAPSYLLRLNPDGSLDTAYKPSVGGSVFGMILLPDDSIVIYGAFTAVGTLTRNHIAHIDGSGNLDTTFDPNANQNVTAAVRQSDGSIVIGGPFTSLTPNGASTSTTRNYIARITATGTVDTAYDPNLNGAVNSLAIDSSNRVIAGGSFTTATPNGATTFTSRNHIARFNSDGTVDKGFDPNSNDAVNVILVQPDGQILIGGAFTQLQPTLNGNLTNPANQSGIARLGTDGNVDRSFTARTNAAVSAITLQPDGSILIGGFFTQVVPTGSTLAVARNHLARLSASGSLDPQFNPDPVGLVGSISISTTNSTVNSIVVGGTFSSLQTNGVLVVGGNFSSVGGLAVQNLAQLNGDGSVNGSFLPTPNGEIKAILPLANGKFVVGGAFTTIGTGAAVATRNGVARFNADSTIDTSYNPASPGSVETLAIQVDDRGDERLLVGGAGLIRLNLDGTRDASFNAGVPFAPVMALAVQRDGKILAAGPGSGVPPRIVRLNSDGSVDASFATVSFANGTDVQAITLQTDGSVIVAGAFTNIGGKGVNYVARLTSTGGVDTSFNPAPNGAVSALALQSDGRLILGGSFSKVGDLQRVGLARLANSGIVVNTLGVLSDNRTITWVRGGTAGEVTRATFELSTDGVSWTTLGTALRSPGTSTWQLGGVTTLPATGLYYIRARGIVPTSAGRSSGVYETVRIVNPGGSVLTSAQVVSAVESSVAWDKTHYVWTVDGNGTIRIADAYSLAAVSPTSTVLVGTTATAVTNAAGGRLADLSTRGTVNPSSPLLSGFAVSGTGSRTVLVRAIGPGLTGFGVTDALATPQLRLYNNTTGAVIASNNGWNNDATLAATFTRTGAFPLKSGSADAALVATLTPGTYSVQVVDGGGATSNGGTALVEIYDAGDLADSSARITNLSSRGTVPANGTLIGGLVVSGTAPKTLLVRGIGPALAKYGVTGVLADPKIAVYDGQGMLVASNDNWSSSSSAMVSDAEFAAAISAAALKAGAFNLDGGSKDAAIVLTLPAGAYTVQVSGTDATSGAGMIELYELP